MGEKVSYGWVQEVVNVKKSKVTQEMVDVMDMEEKVVQKVEKVEMVVDVNEHKAKVQSG